VVLDQVSTAVHAGEVVAVVGPNGAGKSTLLSVLAGDLEPDGGTVTLDGQPLGHWTVLEMALRRAVLLQRVEVSFAFTAFEVVRMGRVPWAGTPLEDLDDAVVAAAMADTDVTEFGPRSLTSLSGGEQARVALSRVLAQQAGVLLLDEPTASLDIAHQEQVLALARTRADAGDAVLVVLHDLGLAASHADRAVVLAGGAVRADGPPAEVFTSELLSDVYRHPIEVLRHPRHGGLIVVPWRPGVGVHEEISASPLAISLP
jgi:iron complex transport system ATP-binding protein